MCLTRLDSLQLCGKPDYTTVRHVTILWHDAHHVVISDHKHSVDEHVGLHLFFTFDLPMFFTVSLTVTSVSGTVRHRMAAAASFA